MEFLLREQSKNFHLHSDMEKLQTFPGFIDVHVHFRDPGLNNAENDESGLAAAKAGGIAKVVVMPNTTPAGDSIEWVEKNLKKGIWPSAAITKGRRGEELSDLESLAEAGAVFFTDDGSFVNNGSLMLEAMRRAAKLNLAVSQHAMMPTNGVMRSCTLAKKLGVETIQDSVETEAIKRDLAFCRETGCRLHIQHISTAQGVELVRQAQKEGLPVTAEATPHHLLFSCDELTVDDANFKMAPPLGNNEDRFELRKGVKDGVLFFATDHAPHPNETKNLGFAKSANGIIGLEVAIAATYDVMVRQEHMSVEKWAEAWWKMPRMILPEKCAKEICDNNLTTTVLTDACRKVDISSFRSLSRNCPYNGMEFTCWPK